MSSEDLLSRLHSHMRTRASEFGLEINDPLPSLDDVVQSKDEGIWYPVPGMCGGFHITARNASDSPTLDVESWSHVIGGSGTHYVITDDSTTLLEQGFV